MDDGSVHSIQGYRVIHNRAFGPVVTGKPIQLGGSYGRHEATGNGVYYATEHFLSRSLIAEHQTVSGARVVIPGFGNVGAIAAQAFFRNGAKITAVSDSQGGIFHEDGLDPESLMAFKKEHGSVVGMPGTTTINNEEILELECDILIPSALGNQIHAGNADRINAKLVVEAANRPTTPRADEILNERGIVLLPDILANAGGVTVSYFEWVQNQANQQWDIEEVNARLRKRMFKVVDTVFDRRQGFIVGEVTPPKSKVMAEASEQKPDFRCIALSLAIDRIAQATLMRGIWP